MNWPDSGHEFRPKEAEEPFMDAYSITLALALATGAAALGAAVIGRARDEAAERPAAAWSRKWGLRAGITALLLTAVSAVSHVFAGHRPGTETALAFAAFLDAHPALFVAAALAAAGILVSYARR